MFAARQLVSSYLTTTPEPTPAQPAMQDESLLFRLPLEIREQIYSYHFADQAYSSLYISPDSKSILSNPVAEGTNHTALLRACKAIYAEALPILHTIHDVHLLVSHPARLERQPQPRNRNKVVYLPETHVCSQQSMLQSLQHRITRVSITVQLDSFSPYSPIVQKLAWLLEVLNRRQKKLESLTIHVYDNLIAFSGCCPVTDYFEGSRWDVHPKTVLVRTSGQSKLGRDARLGDGLLEECAEEWQVAFSMNEGRIKMGQTAQGHWTRLVEDLQDVERVLKGNGSWREWDPKSAWVTILQAMGM